MLIIVYLTQICCDGGGYYYSLKVSQSLEPLCPETVCLVTVRMREQYLLLVLTYSRLVLNNFILVNILTV